MKQKVNNAPLSLYFRVWWQLAKLRFIDHIINSRFGGFFFLFGKLIRLSLQVIFLLVLVNKTHSLEGYTLPQLLFILFAFHLASTFVQIFLRSVYQFRDHLLSGYFDFFLVNPLNELFYSLFSYLDPLDVIMVIPSFLSLLFAWRSAHLPLSLASLLIFLTCLLLYFLFAVAWNIFIISFALFFLESDNLIMLYRDLEKMASFPITIYGQKITFFLTYVFPLAVATLIPLQILSHQRSLLSTLIFFTFLASLELGFAFLIWRRALLTYTSASS